MMEQTLSGSGSIVVFQTVASLEANLQPLSTAFVQGYYAAGDGGQGLLSVGPSATASGGTIYKDAAGQTWYRAEVNEGRPEWFGAKPNDPSFDSLPALTACIAACAKTKLQAATYYTSGTLVLGVSYVTLEGENPGCFGTGGAVIAVRSSTADGILVGLASDPGSRDRFVQGVNIRNISVIRTVAPTPPAAGSEIPDSPSGMRIQYVLGATVENCYVSNNSIGYNINQVVFSHFVRCYSDRTENGNSATNDIYWAFAISGTGPYSAESVYLTECSSEYNPTAQGSTIGFALIGQFTDTFISRCEVDGHQYAVYASGGAAQTAHSIDNQITGCVFDQCKEFGILIENQIAGSSFKISGNYVVMSATGSTAAYTIDGSVAAVTLTGNEAIGDSGSTAVGLMVRSAANVYSSANNWVNLMRPVELVSATSCHVSDNVLNTDVTGLQGAVSMTGVSRCVVDCMINGSKVNFPQGVAIDATSTYNEIRCSGINPSAISGGAAQKLVYNGLSITDAGAFGTGNLAQGIMG